jgi:hypothetical protein
MKNGVRSRDAMGGELPSEAPRHEGPYPREGRNDDPHAWDWPIVCGHLWYVQSGWQEDGAGLASLGGEIAAKLAAK